MAREASREGPWRGAFEAHLTVDAADGDARAAFAALCNALGVKCVLIELAEGVHPSQPMTASHHVGELAGEVVPAIHALRDRLAAAGFPPVRVKVEALALDGLRATPGGYFEFHAKLRLPAGGDPAAVLAICRRHGAHLSRNARERAAAHEDRFATLRVATADRAAAEAAFDALLAALAAFPIVATKREYTVFDGRVALDAGWL